LPKTPVISGRDMVRILERLGYVVHGQRGSHVGLEHPTLGIKISVPLHGNRPLRTGTRDPSWGKLASPPTICAGSSAIDDPGPSPQRF
jgi:predicted RNA binding protein YcfA (HicA-like mRNA interferase family)